MAGYKRFVSYIYEYKKGRKAQNTGFAKIESRNGICKIQLQLQDVPQEAGELQVYAFVRKGDWLKGILLGKASPQTAAEGIKIMTPSEHVGNVDYALEDLAGLWINSVVGGTYLSVWDDEPVEVHRLVTEIPGENGEMETVSGADEIDYAKADEKEDSLETADSIFRKNTLKAEEVSEVNGQEADRVLKEDIPKAQEESGEGTTKEQGESEEGTAKAQEESEEGTKQMQEESGKDGSQEREMPAESIPAAESLTDEGVDKEEEVSEASIPEGDDTPGEMAETEEKIPEADVTSEGKAAIEESVPDTEEFLGEKAAAEEGIPEADLTSESKAAEASILEAKETAGDDWEGDTAEASSMKTEAVSEEAVPEKGISNNEAISTESISQEENQPVGNQEGSRANPAHTQEAFTCPMSQRLRNNCRNCQPGLDQRWQFLAKRYSHAQPFEGGEVLDCIRIAPRDLNVLRQNQWQLGRNSFLMHGYYNYRHLLFGKCKDGSYFLGIPGIQDAQEEFMASMFGFPNFRKAAQQKGRGIFGYWCRPVE